MSSTVRTTPRNIGTQCENIDLESARESGTMTKGLWLKKSLKNYFGIPVQVSDPLLNVAGWIAYVTEVGVETGNASDIHKIQNISLQDWCNCYGGNALALILPGYHHLRICAPSNLPRLRVLPHLCPDLPRRWSGGHLLPALHVGQTFQAPSSWSATGSHIIKLISDE